MSLKGAIKHRAGRTAYWLGRLKSEKKKGDKAHKDHASKKRLDAIRRKTREIRDRYRDSQRLGVELERKLRAQAQRARARAKSDAQWQGSRAVTNEVIRIVNGRVPITSRKRSAGDPLSLANPGSDHSGAQKGSDAVDFATVNNHRLKNEISRRLGGPNELADYGSFNIRRNAHTFRVQMIAGTHGTGPHLHVGVRKVA